MIDNPEAPDARMGKGSAYWKSMVSAGYLPRDGYRMYYEIHGTGKPLVTFPPIWGLANVLPSLTGRHQLIAVEPRGHGRSSDVDRPLSFEEMADDAAALLQHLGVKQADVFGESVGGVTALQLAIRHPQLVRRVAVYASPLGGFGSYDESQQAEFIGLQPDAYGVQFQREAYERAAPNPAGWTTLFSKMSRIDLRGFSPEELQSVTVPVLIACGDHDMINGPAFLGNALNWYRLVPRAQLAVVPNASHFVLNEDPDKLMPIIATFLDEPESDLPWATPQTGYHPGVNR